MSRSCLSKFSTIAYQCLHKDRKQRPTIAKIVSELEIALQFQYQDQMAFSKKDDFAPYRTAADAAARIQAASREPSLTGHKEFDHRTMSAEYDFSIVDHEARNHMAAVCIQNRFRTWKTRKEFPNTVNRIQNMFRTCKALLNLHSDPDGNAS